MIEYLSRAKVAEREGLSISTIDGYVRRGYMPDPDAESAATMNYSGNPFSSWIGENFNPINN